MARIRVNLSPHDAAGAAAQVAIRRHLEGLVAQQPGAISGDVEAIHQLRVATRRLRAALRLFRSYLAGSKPQTMRAELAWLSSVAGVVREVDVSEELARRLAGRLRSDSGKDLQPLWRELKMRRRREHRKLAAALRSVRYRKLVDELGQPFPTNTSGDAALGAVAIDLVRPILRRTMADGAKAASKGSSRALHRLRVSVKRSRYALEMLRPLATPGLAKALKQLEAAQDLLGGYHDAVVAVELVRKCALEIPLDGGPALAAGALVESIARRERKLALQSVAEWKRLDAEAMEREALGALTGQDQAEVASSR